MSWLARHWKSLLVMTVATVAFVAVTAATGGLGAPALLALASGGFASGVAAYATQQLLDKQPLTMGGALKAGAISTAVTVATVGLARVLAPVIARAAAPVVNRALPRGAAAAVAAIPHTARSAAVGAAVGGPANAGVKIVENAHAGKPLLADVGEAYALGTINGAIAGPIARVVTTPAANAARAVAGKPALPAPVPSAASKVLPEATAEGLPLPIGPTSGTAARVTEVRTPPTSAPGAAPGPAPPPGEGATTVGIRGALLGEEGSAVVAAVRKGAARGAVSRDTSAVLQSLPGDRKVTIAVDEGYGPGPRRTVTVEEASKLLENPKVERLDVKEVPPAGNGDASAVLGKFQQDGKTGWIEQWPNDGTLIDSQVKLASGETVAFKGSRDMLVDLARDPAVESVTTGDPAPGMRWLHDVPASERAAGHDPAVALTSQIGPGVRQTASQAGLDKVQIYHGTIKGYEASVRAGPRNVGKGFGGRGLYVAVDEPKVAEFFADWAASESKARAGMFPEGYAAGPEASRGVVLRGRFEPSADLRVGVFQITRGGKPDLARGVLPSDWADNPNLVKVLESQFDVLDLRGMKSSGLVIDTDRFLVIHESAGKGAIRWD